MEMYSGSCSLMGMVRVIGIEMEEGGGVGTKKEGLGRFRRLDTAL